ncbi:MAG: Crp/Fnr family transcriptional regulator [Bryobacteraceae bacterium]|nr:Crp/Fnr family transcriptional regulator [Bryobacteraceae bacterium]
MRIRYGRNSPPVFEQAEDCQSVYFVEAGFVKLLRKIPDGLDALTGLAGPGDLFGEEALFGASRRFCTAIPMLPGSAISVPSPEFRAWVGEMGAAWPDVWKGAMQRQEFLLRKIELLCTHDVEYRMLCWLGDLGARFADGEGCAAVLPLTQLDLAQLIGATRETTSTRLNLLARRGLLQLRRGSIEIPSLEQLNREALLRPPGRARRPVVADS